MAEACRRSKRDGDGFAGSGGHSANLEARRSFLRGSWRLSTPSLTHPIKMYVVRIRKRNTCLQLYSLHFTYHTCTPCILNLYTVQKNLVYCAYHLCTMYAKHINPVHCALFIPTLYTVHTNPVHRTYQPL